MTELLVWQVWLVTKVTGAYEWTAKRAAAVRGRARDDAGEITVQNVIWYAVGAALAIAASAVIVTLVMNKVNSVNLDTPKP